jgi:hypothetical protein
MTGASTGAAGYIVDQSPVEIVNRELGEKIMWGNELKTRVQEKFGFTAAIQGLIEQLAHIENQLSL